MEESKRQKQVGKLIQTEISNIIQLKSASIHSGGLISVSKVVMTPDLLESRIYLSLFQIEDTKKVISELNQNSWEYRKELGERLRHNLRRIPEIQFFLDDTLDYVFHMEEVFKKINKK